MTPCVLVDASVLIYKSRAAHTLRPSGHSALMVDITFEQLINPRKFSHNLGDFWLILSSRLLVLLPKK